MSYFKKIVCALGLCCGTIFQCFAESSNNNLMPLEATRIKLFEILYPQQLTTLEQKKAFVKKYYKSSEEHETFIFPNQTLENVYNAYVRAYPTNAFGVSILHKELPRTNKAFRADSNDERMGYVLMYVWDGDKKLTITNTRIEDDNLCGKELLEFEEQKGQTILKSNFEQYCF
ncbi:hypothetical protein [Helicobacter trogontum]|uniref:Uncharacterized protein n=1 Tax=Helicobacter trogontum TaxID=50960 RepID=A0A4U8S984_9HELI|nr:hypothetical protein [Helicobacter trogontum]TLD82476.1 hypothetical protein LS81_008050 [Helicobacter trogontum]